MKYEITKGSAKDFELAPEWATLKERNTSGDLFFSEGHSVGCRVQGITTEHDFTIDDGNNDFTHLTLIAERRPVTEPVVNQQLTTEWDGEYPIPAGVNVEVHFDGDDSRVWTEFRVEYMRGDVVVLYDYRSDGVESWPNARLSFRSIRSPEDVARDDFIKKLSGNVIEGFPIGTKFAAALYDAGYRKME